MATGSPFEPAPFAQSVVAPQVASAFRRASYLTPQDYRFAPTAVSTKSLVSSSVAPQTDSTASLAVLIEQASGWVDEICLHRPDGSFAASVITEAGAFSGKPDGSVALICNNQPVLEVTGLALGPAPAAISNVDSSTAQNIWISRNVIHVPATWSTSPVPYTYPTGPGGILYAVWTYVGGYPNTLLAASVLAGATSITLQPSVPGGTALAGIYAGTRLAINDDALSEVVVASATPAGLTVALASPLVKAHTVPPAPDGIRVSALPRAIERATVYLVNVLIKTRGTRAMQMPQTPGGMPGRQGIAEAGAVDDYEFAAKLLKPFVMPYLR